MSRVFVIYNSDTTARSYRGDLESNISTYYTTKYTAKISVQQVNDADEIASDGTLLYMIERGEPLSTSAYYRCLAETQKIVFVAIVSGSCNPITLSEMNFPAYPSAVASQHWKIRRVHFREHNGLRHNCAVHSLIQKRFPDCSTCGSTCDGDDDDAKEEIGPSQYRGIGRFSSPIGGFQCWCHSQFESVCCNSCCRKQTGPVRFWWLIVVCICCACLFCLFSCWCEWKCNSYLHDLYDYQGRCFPGTCGK